MLRLILTIIDVTDCITSRIQVYTRNSQRYQLDSSTDFTEGRYNARNTFTDHRRQLLQNRYVYAVVSRRAKGLSIGLI